MVVGDSLMSDVATLAVVLAGLEQVEPMEADVGPDLALEAKNLCGVDHAHWAVEPK